MLLTLFQLNLQAASGPVADVALLEGGNVLEVSASLTAIASADVVCPPELIATVALSTLAASGDLSELSPGLEGNSSIVSAGSSEISEAFAQLGVLSNTGISSSESLIEQANFFEVAVSSAVTLNAEVGLFEQASGLEASSSVGSRLSGALAELSSELSVSAVLSPGVVPPSEVPARSHRGGWSKDAAEYERLMWRIMDKPSTPRAPKSVVAQSIPTLPGAPLAVSQAFREEFAQLAAVVSAPQFAFTFKPVLTLLPEDDIPEEVLSFLLDDFCCLM